MDLSTRLASAREAKKWTQKQLATYAGVHEVSIANWERGAKKMGFASAVKVGRACSVNPYWLVGKSEERAIPPFWAMTPEEYRSEKQPLIDKLAERLKIFERVGTPEALHLKEQAIHQLMAYGATDEDIQRMLDDAVGAAAPEELDVEESSTSDIPKSSVTPAPDTPLTREELRESVTDLAKSTADAILHQEQEFVGQMRLIGEQLEKRDARQEHRDSQTAHLIDRLLARLEESSHIIERNSQVIDRASRLIESQGNVIEKLRASLDDTTDLDADADADDDGTNGPTHGRR